jgi:tight adherence protein B
MAPLLLAFGVFLLVTAAVIGAFYAYKRLPQYIVERRVQQRMADVARHVAPEQTDTFNIVKEQVEGVLPGLDKLATDTSYGNSIAKLIEQAGSKKGVSTVLLTSLVFGIALAFALTMILREPWGLLPGFAGGAAVPFLVLLRKRTVRFRKFEEQFPEALDLLSRAIKAGHAFTTAMGMVADDASDPIGPEFRKTFDEQNFGLPLKDALANMTDRTPLLDVRFFATAVLIQRDTGGNLAEILENLAGVVRERFKILRQVRVYTAHGRLTGYVLLALPAALAVALSFTSPDSMNLLFRDRLGQMLLMGAAVMQFIGYMWIRQIVKIEV